MKKISQTILVFILVNLSGVLLAANSYTADIRTGLHYMEQGDYQNAITVWNNLLSEHDTNIEILIQRGETYRLLGYNHNAISDLSKAIFLAKKLADKNNNKKLLLMSSIALAQALLQDRQIEPTINLLNHSIELAANQQRNDILAAAYNMLGNIALSLENIADARTNYLKGIEFAKKIDDISLIVSMQINLSRIISNQKDSQVLLKQAYQNCTRINNPLERSMLLVAIGVQATKNKMHTLAFSALSESIADAKLLHNEHLLSQSQGYLGQMYEADSQYEKAFELTTQAISSAQKISASDLLLEWEWQQARIENKKGYQYAAISSYRNAISHIQSIRNDIPIQYSDGRSSFRETLSPIYLGLVDLLLKASDESDSNADQQQLLTEALETIELFKTAEMQDYFKNSCAVKKKSLIDAYSIPKGSAILYPVIFPDKLEILLLIGEKKYHYASPASQQSVHNLVEQLTDNLKPNAYGQLSPYNTLIANTIYNLLIKPIEHKLLEEEIDTIVYSPDGILRSLPIGTLWDGKKFLIEKYAIATIAGLTMINTEASDSNTANKKQIQALLAGVSNPGKVVDELPVNIQSLYSSSDSTNELMPAAHLSRQFKMRALPEYISPNKKPRSLTLKPHMRKYLQQSLALPGVIHEIEEISRKIPSTQLMNEQFLLKNFSSAVNGNYRIIHIASHGFFSGTPESSFIITFDKILNMITLEELFQSEAFSDSPIEILTLSACQTAEGDDRSPLGLSGVVLKSGVKSVLGSLWPVADDVAKNLLPDFYNNIITKNYSKAKALQQAQLNILNSKAYSHPGLWSPFILVGNWN